MPKIDETFSILTEDCDEIVGVSAQIQFIKHYIDRVAPSEATVLITGETGTGKELFARRLHRMSKRRGAPLVSINCAAIPDNLIESELFGFERGAFTGAVSRQAGKFVQASGGTLFLDEIGDLSPSAQAKILRVLEEKEVQPLGSRTTQAIDVRLVAATHRNLEQFAAQDKFRADLFYRVSAISVHVPALRDRPEDVPLIAAHFLARLSLRYDRPFAGLTPGATAYLKQHPWNGNVRELRNVVERALLFSDSEYIGERDLTGNCHSTDVWQAQTAAKLESGRRATDQKARSRKVICSKEAERRQLRSALEHTNWNKTKTAEMLQWSRMTIYRKIALYDLHPPIDVQREIECARELPGS